MSDHLAGFKCTEKNISKQRENLVWKVDFQSSASLSVNQMVLAVDLMVRNQVVMSVLGPNAKITLGKRACN